jgi:hypothetical protein
VELLTHDVESLTFRKSNQPEFDYDSALHRQKHRKFDKVHMRKVLVTILARNEKPPPSMAQVASRLGYDQGFLAKKLPRECQRISERFSKYQAERMASGERNLRNKIRRTVIPLRKQGIYPSSHQVKKLVGLNFRYGDAHAAYVEIMSELGYY